jgi:hypothetical protein
LFALKPDYSASKARIDAFWERELIDRPVVQFKLYKPRAEHVELPISRHSTPAERWMDAQFQAEFALADLSNQLFLGDTLPVAWPNLGPDLLAALYGCQLEFGDFGTSWSRPCLKDWQDTGEIKLDWNSPYLECIDQITDALVQIGSGKFIIGITDLHTGGDALAAMRGPMNLALDLITRPDQVIHMLYRLEADFQALYDHFYLKLRASRLPITTWTSLIADGKYYLPSNDFSIMISQAMFEKYFLPFLRRECQF